MPHARHGSRPRPRAAILAVVLSLTALARPAAAQYSGLQLIGDHYFDAPQSGTNVGFGIRGGSNTLFGDNEHWASAFSGNYIAQEIDAPDGPTRSSYFDMTASIQWSPVAEKGGWWPYVGVGWGWMLDTREAGQVGPLGGTSIPLTVGTRTPSALFVELQYWGKMPEMSDLGEGKSRRLALALGYAFFD